LAERGHPRIVPKQLSCRVLSPIISWSWSTYWARWTCCYIS
jgi:hypothetical protein